jgi:hypothetical protein
VAPDHFDLPHTFELLGAFGYYASLSGLFLFALSGYFAFAHPDPSLVAAGTLLGGAVGATLYALRSTAPPPQEG